MAASCLFDRNPSEPDYTDRLKLLFGRDAYQDAQHLFSADGQTLKEQQIHQKIEIGKIEMLKQSADTVLTLCTGKSFRREYLMGERSANLSP